MTTVWNFEPLAPIVWLLLLVLGIVNLILILKNKSAQGDVNKIKEEIMKDLRDARMENAQYAKDNMQMMSESVNGALKQASDAQDKRLSELSERFRSMSMENEQKLENIRAAVEMRLKTMQENNEKQLETIRGTVDEKLQKTLNERIGESFKVVSERLEQVYKGLGEMQTLATGVGDLKKVLSNVKTRGILGELQLGAILEQILSPEQYEMNIVTKPNSRDPVEFAIKLPGNDDGFVYLPIDSKFPGDLYSNLMDAYESGDAELVNTQLRELDKFIKLSAKTIRDKYVSPPQTTDFAIMFLPFEGLYAEVVKRGLLEVLQRDYKITVAGPTTMAAMLNSLQMGFRTLAIQKHSSEVWDVLGAVKTEFEKFGGVLEATQNRLDQANKELEKLVGTRTRQIQRALKNVTQLPTSESERLIGDINDTEL
ncbi:MAG: DNA recombination protein RmuC [Clostridia bacterium]|nr:DNA recombination protein RmuC [Clostridia bacterium]